MFSVLYHHRRTSTLFSDKLAILGLTTDTFTLAKSSKSHKQTEHVVLGQPIKS